MQGAVTLEVPVNAAEGAPVHPDSVTIPPDGIGAVGQSGGQIPALVAQRIPEGQIIALQCIICNGRCIRFDTEHIQRRAPGKGLGADGSDLTAQINAGQVGIVLKCVVADGGGRIDIQTKDLIPVFIPGIAFCAVQRGHLTLGTADIQPSAAVQIPVEVLPVAAGNGIGQTIPGQLAAVVLPEGLGPQFIIIGIPDRRRHAGERILRDLRCCPREIDRGQAAAAGKGIAANGGDVLSEAQIGNSCVIPESAVTDGNILSYIIGIKMDSLDLIHPGSPGVGLTLSGCFHSTCAINVQHTIALDTPLEAVVAAAAQFIGEAGPADRTAADVVSADLVPGFIAGRVADLAGGVPEGVNRKFHHIAVEPDTLYDSAVGKGAAFHGSHCTANLHVLQSGVALEDMGSNGGEVIDIHISDLRFVFIPGIFGGGGKFTHLTAAADLQIAVAVQRPAAGFAEAALGNDAGTAAGEAVPGQLTAVILQHIIIPAAVAPVVVGIGRNTCESILCNRRRIAVEIDLTQGAAVRKGL